MINDFYALRLRAGFNCKKSVAEFCGVSVRTIINWERNGAPIMAIRLMGLLDGDLSHMGNAWRGVFLEPDCLSISKIDFVYPCEIGAIRHLYVAASIERFQCIDNSKKPFKLKGVFSKPALFTPIPSKCIFWLNLNTDSDLI